MASRKIYISLDDVSSYAPRDLPMDDSHFRQASALWHQAAVFVPLPTLHSEHLGRPAQRPFAALRDRVVRGPLKPSSADVGLDGGGSALGVTQGSFKG